MKLEITKEQCVAHAKAEGDAEIGAGLLAGNAALENAAKAVFHAAGGSRWERAHKNFYRKLARAARGEQV